MHGEWLISTTINPGSLGFLWTHRQTMGNLTDSLMRTFNNQLFRFRRDSPCGLIFPLQAALSFGAVGGSDVCMQRGQVLLPIITSSHVWRPAISWRTKGTHLLNLFGKVHTVLWCKFGENSCNRDLKHYFERTETRRADKTIIFPFICSLTWNGSNLLSLHIVRCVSGDAEMITLRCGPFIEVECHYGAYTSSSLTFQSL